MSEMQSKRPIKKGRRRQRRFGKLLSAAIAVVLVAAMGAGLFLNSGMQVSAAGLWEADGSTHDAWYEGSLGVSGQGGDSTKNTGRVWTDKSVYTSDLTLTSESGEERFTIENDEGTALVGLSALSSAANISGQTTINQPLDIVLVLDRSGSMNDRYLTSSRYDAVYDIVESSGHTEERDGIFGSWTAAVQDTRGGEYYALIGDEYVRINEVTREVTGDWGTSYDEHISWTVNGQTVEPKTSVSDQDSSHIQFYTYTSTETRIDVAMETAVTNFINTVATENVGKEQSDQHRIAIVDYAGDVSQYSSGRGSNRTCFAYCTQGANANALIGYVEDFTYNGGTEADLGFDRAQDIINGDSGYGSGARDEAKKVVIFFTDGMPGDGDYVENDNAGSSVNTAYQMKQAGTAIYSVGVFEGADPGDLTGQGSTTHDANYFMNAVSSNYPDAQSERTGNNRVDFSDNCTLGERAEGNYYFAASDAEALNDVFQSIYDDFSSGAVSPIENTTTIGGDQVGYLTFEDTLGNYMEVKNLKTIVFAGEEFHYSGTQPSADGSGSHEYHFTGTVSGNDVYPGDHNLSDIIITVNKSADLQTGDTVTVQIPSSLLPLRVYTAESETVNGETTTSTSVVPAYPIRVYYTVGLKSGVMDGSNIDASKLDGTYISTHMDEDGNVYFYSNAYSGGNNGTTTATFTPAETNSFYYFTEDTTIYTRTGQGEAAEYSPVESYVPDQTYYYQRTYYAENELKTEWVSFIAAENQLGRYVQYDESTDSYYIEKGSPRLTRAMEFEAAKEEGANTTETAANAISPTWNGTAIVVSLGNNGKIAYPVSGSLQISKIVDWADTGVTHDEKEFTYTVDLEGDVQGRFDYIKYNAQGQPVDADGNPQTVAPGAQPAATGQIQDGETLSLSNGEHVVISGLPANTDFTVTEAAAAGYTASNTVEGAASDDGNIAEGTIASNDTIEVAYTNTYSVTPATLAEGSIHGTKTLTGRDWRDNESFTFTLTPVTPGAPLPGDAQESASVTLTNSDANNYAESQEVAFDFDSITYTSAGRYIYLVQETEGDEYGLAYSNAVYRVTVNVTDDGTGKLSASIESMYRTFNDNGDSTGDNENDWPPIDDRNAAFVNSFGGEEVDYANITGVKIFMNYTTGETLDINDFYFTLTAVTPGAPMPDETRTGNLGTGAIEFSDITFGIDDIGKTYEYQIKEEVPAGAVDNGDGTATLNGMTYDTSTKTVSIAVTQDQQTGSVVATVTGNGFEFTNSYQASSVTTEGAADGLQITKRLDGAAGTKGQFTFTMTAANEETVAAITNGWVTGIDADGNVKTSPAIAKDGSANILFDNLTFTHPGTYTFNITETQNAPNNAWIYDGHTYQVSFTVTDVNGQLTIADPVTTSGSSTFTNSYEASMNFDNEAGGILFSKTLNGRALTANQFNFTVTTPEGDTASAEKLDEATRTLSNSYGAADGKAALWRGIAGLTFDQDDAGKTFTFIISETNGGASGYTYDDKSVTVEIAVNDDGDGSMSTVTTVTKDGSEPVVYKSEDFVRDNSSTYPTAAFVNSYDAADADPVSAGFEKQLTGRDWKETDSFEFTLSTDIGKSEGVTAGDLEAAMPDTRTATVSGANAVKTFSFGDFTFTKAGIYAYKVTETQPADDTDTAGVSYSTATAVITFTVTDDGTGKLQVNTDVTGVDVETDTNTGIFTNTYSYAPATLEQNTDTGIGIQKTVTGAPNTEDFTFTAVFNADDEKNTGSIDDIEGLTDGKLTAIISEDFAAGNTKSVDFGTVTFRKPGVYVFDVTEDNTTTATGWIYDRSTHQIVVTVTDNTEGELIASVEGNDPVFTNSYTAGSVVVGDDEALRITKEVTGAPAMEEFAFTLQLTVGNRANVKVGTGETAAEFPEEGISASTSALAGTEESQTVSFGDLTFTAGGTYTFTVTETTTTEVEGWTYDNQPKTITVSVTDDRYDGQLDAIVEGNNQTITNAYRMDLPYDDPDNLNDGLNVVKNLTGHDLEEGQFTFTLTAEDAASAAKAGIEDGLSKTFTNSAQTHNAEGISTDIMRPFAGMSFTQDDVGKTYRYTITEVDSRAAGYTYDSKSYEVAIVISGDGKGTLTATTTVSTGGQSTEYICTTNTELNKGPAVVTFDNSYKAESTLGASGQTSIEAKKVLENRDLIDKEFTFQVFDANNSVVATGTNDADGNITFEDIRYEITQMLKDVKNGIATHTVVDGRDTYTYQYTVAEDITGLADEGITPVAHTFNIAVTVTDNGDGTLSIAVIYPGDGTELTFRNTYGEAAEATLPIIGEKKLEHADNLTPDDISGKFNFTITSDDPDAPMPASTEAKNDRTGTVSFGDIEFTMENVFGDASDASEEETEDPAEEPGTDVDAPEAEEPGTGTDVPEAEEPGTGTDVPETEEPGTGTDVPETEEPGTGTDLPETEEPGTGTDVPETEEPGTDAETPDTDGTAGESEAEVIEAAGQDLVVKNGKSGIVTDPETGKRTRTFTYTVTETGEVPGVSNDTPKTFTVTVTDNGNGTISIDSEGTDGTLFTFTNTYSVKPTDPTDPTHPDASGEAAVTIRKELSGRAMNEGEFSFIMQDAGDTRIEAKNAADGSVTFTGIEFSAPGDYRYQIREVPGELGGVVYDSSVYYATAEVTDNGDGTLSAKWTVKDTDGNPIDSIVFQNEYSYQGTVGVTLAASKSLSGRTLKAGEFIFLLKDSNGNVVSKAVNSETGAIQFADLNFDTPGSYTYTISEEKGNAENVTYDSTVYTVTIHVTDSGKGYLTASIDNGGKAIAFTNTYKEPERDTSDGGSSSGSGGSSSPAPVQAVQSAQTGDSSPIALFVGIIAVSLLAIAAALAVYFRKSRQR
jgi:pilin isopeptide linkage protein